MTLPEPETPTADLILLSPSGRELARFSSVPLGGASEAHLIAAAYGVAAHQFSGKELWLLHDGGRAFGRQVLPARFEVLGDQTDFGPVAPPLLGARPWQLPGWNGEVLSWMQGHLGQRVTDLRWIHATDVGAIVTALAGQADRVYLKAGEDAAEVSAATQIAARMPGLTPQILAADPERGWLLTADAGERLLESADLNLWLTGVRRLADLQRHVRFEGLPLHSFSALPAQVRALLAPEVLNFWGLSTEVQVEIRALLPRLLGVHRAVSKLAVSVPNAGAGLPECACHGDFHPNNVLVLGEQLRLFDFSEACTAHPLTDIGWFLGFTMLPMRSELAPRREHSDLGERLWEAYQTELGFQTGLPWQDVALLALFHRAVVYDARFRDGRGSRWQGSRWQGTVPGGLPQYVPYCLRITRYFGAAG